MMSTGYGKSAIYQLVGEKIDCALSPPIEGEIAQQI
jgi:hypothetical protein